MPVAGVPLRPKADWNEGGFSAFSGTNLVVVKQASGDHSFPSDAPTWITVFIAAMVAVITGKQLCLAREKFKLDMFKKRFAVYTAMQELMATSINQPRADAHLAEYRRKAGAGAFLFKPNLVAHLETLVQLAAKARAVQAEGDSLAPGSKGWSAKAEERLKLENELHKELRNLKDHFAPYLKFKVWKQWPWSL